MSYIAPSYGARSFTCPWCGICSSQEWYQVVLQRGSVHTTHMSLWYSKCMYHDCGRSCLWEDECLIFPLGTAAPLANRDLPEAISAEFNEARAIADISPRGAAALLRLCIQMLCKELGEPGKHLNTDIKSLVAKGLPVQIQQALDTVRVIGNFAVHPGELDVRDDRATVYALFELVNMIAERMISEPKRVAALYAKLPETQLIQIDSRDG